MHTVKIIAGGLLLLGVCLLIARGVHGGVSGAAKCFLGLWLVLTLANMWIGVSRAGYSVRDEAPIALVVFAVPALVAGIVWWRSSL